MRLTKEKYGHATVFLEALQQYVANLATCPATDENKIKKSVAVEFYTEIEKRLNKEFPSQHLTFKLAYHKAKVLGDTYNNSIIKKCKEDLFAAVGLKI